MASFLPVIVSKKKKTNREKKVFYCSVSQIHINPEKKNIEISVLNVPTYLPRPSLPGLEKKK